MTEHENKNATTDIDSLELLKLNPHAVEKVWGGSFLGEYDSGISNLSNTQGTENTQNSQNIQNIQNIQNLHNIHKSGLPIGERWELADLAEGSCYYKEMPISKFIETNFLNNVLPNPRYNFWGEGEACPYIIKYIDAARNLSVQVHPTEKYLELTNCDKYAHLRAKSECWLILSVDESKSDRGDGGIPGVYLGLRPGVTSDDMLFALENPKQVAPDYLLNFYPAEVGDFWVVPAGTVHALGAGILLLEVQQSSGITYRLWDWERSDKRELHIKQALQCINFDKKFNQELVKLSQKNIWRPIYMQMNGDTYVAERKLFEHPEFKVSNYLFRRGDKFIFSLFKRKCRRAVTFICLGGRVLITRGARTEECLPFQTVLATFAGEESITVIASEKSKLVIVE
ncbi:MAG: class I mannose-6-phosphate isomerase [Oligoflexia bacterium]|nr:class I mannose-6-phosphate isomerase [Oligoflexia bacterium]